MKRFYREAVAGPAAVGGFEILLDGRPVRTPQRQALVVATAPLAEAIAAEWAEQGEQIRPVDMRLTGLANTAIDRIAEDRGAIFARLIDYAEFDLICYWADEPPDLAARQRAAWAPVLDWARSALGASLATTTGLARIGQPAPALAALRARLVAEDSFALSAISEATQVTGSLLLALALCAGRLDVDQAFHAATVDEAFQADRWGEDGEAREVLEARHRDLRAAHRFYRLLGGRVPG